MTLEDDQDVPQRWQRFMDVADEPVRMLPPIQGFENKPLVSLEEAVKPLVDLVPKVENYALEAKNMCTGPPANELSIDESASIRLYTMEWKQSDISLYTVLNKTLRAEDRNLLKPWFLYLRLIIWSLSKIPSTHRHIFRGVKLNLSQLYVRGEKVVWWAFTSCTTSLQVLESKKFLGKSGDRTLFDIDCYSGIDIGKHSRYPSESEILLLPATEFQIVASLNSGNGLHIITLKEIEPRFPLPGKISAANVLPQVPISKWEPESFQNSYVTNTTEPKSKPINVPRRNSRLERRIAQYQPCSVIDLGKEQLTDEDMRIVVREAIVEKRCTKLYLPNNQITSDGMTTIAEAMRDSTTLEELDFSNNHLTDTDLLPLVKELSINEKTNIVQWKCCGIAKMKELDKAPIKELNLSNNDIGDLGVQYMAAIIRSKRTLTTLHLNDNKISDGGIKSLANALSHAGTNLVKLYLHNNKLITDLSVDALIDMLRQNQSLNTLWLINCNITYHGRQRLQEAAASKGRDFYLNIEKQGPV